MFRTLLLCSNFFIGNLDKKRFNLASNDLKITPDCVNKRFNLKFDGKPKVLLITKMHIGHFFGEFIKTRKCGHSRKLTHRVKSYKQRCKLISISR